MPKRDAELAKWASCKVWYFALFNEIECWNTLKQVITEYQRGGMMEYPKMQNSLLYEARN